MTDTWTARLVLVAVAAAPAAVIAVVSAHGGPGWALAGVSSTVLAAEVAAAVALVAAGVVVCVRGPDARSGWLLAAAGLLRLVAEWNNPDGAPGAAVFTMGLALAAAAPAALAHTLLVYGDGRVRGALTRAVVVAAYAGAVLMVGLVPAVLSDPRLEGCSSCPANLLRAAADPGLATHIRRWGIALMGFSLALATVIALVRLTHASGARRRLVVTIVLPGCAVLALAVIGAAHAWGRGFLSNDPVDRGLWLAQALAIGLVALGVVWQRLRARQMRATLARIVIELGDSSRPGGLRAALADALGDPDLELRYDDDTANQDDRATTRLVRDGRVVATLVHRRGLLDDPGLVAELGRTARLALEHDRLNTQLRAQLAYLRSSRAQIVAVGDAERRRIERDLHDGAQQTLAGLAIAIGLARADTSDGERADRLGGAQELIRSALREVRSLAHATSPATLADGGLAAALDGLAEWAPQLELGSLPQRRLDPATESAAYFVVAALTRDAAGPVRVDVRIETGTLVLEVRTNTPSRSLVELEDRVGALDGELRVEPAEDGMALVRVALACES